MQFEIADDKLASLLKQHAIPVLPDDTLSELRALRSLLDNIIQKLEGRGSNGRTDPASQPAIDAATTDTSVTTYRPDSPPDLTFTKVLSAKINGKPAARAMWNPVLKELIEIAKTRARNEDDLRRLITVNFVVGRKEDEGYEYLPNAGLSVQYQDTNSAWKGIAHLSQQLKLPVDIVFVWRHKERAAFPGKTGRFVVGK